MLHEARMNFQRTIVNRAPRFPCRGAAQFKTNKDSIERSAPRTLGVTEGVTARSLNAIRG